MSETVKMKNERYIVREYRSVMPGERFVIFDTRSDEIAGDCDYDDREDAGIVAARLNSPTGRGG